MKRFVIRIAFVALGSRYEMTRAAARLKTLMRTRFAPLYAVVFAMIVAAFLWQMLHGICPVP